MAQSVVSRKTPLTVFERNPHQNHHYDGKMEELSETCNFGERVYQCWRVAKRKTNHGDLPLEPWYKQPIDDSTEGTEL